MRKSRATVITVVSLVLLVGCTAQTTQVSGQPTTGLRQSAIGYDVSYPQCGRLLPQQAAFAVVGLNGTLAKNFNPCFQTEARWAEHATNSTSMPKLSIYVHVANPGSAAPNWPRTGINSDGICAGGDTTPCSYQYGEILAKDDIAHLTTEEVSSYSMVFMDVEDNYSWQTVALNDNAAVMEGMTATFKAAGDTVGIYSDTKQWTEIVGDTTRSSILNGLPDWVLGGYSLATAKHNCTSHGFTGSVILTQIAGPNYPIDEDFSCVS